MFNRYIIILSLLFAFAYVPIYADDCTDGLTEARALYNNDNYQKAKELFEYVKSEGPQLGSFRILRFLLALQWKFDVRCIHPMVN